MKRRSRIGDTVVLIALAAYALPFFWQFLTSFKPDALLMRLPPLVPARFTTAHYEAVWARSVIPRALGNSLGVAAITTVLALVLGLFAAWIGTVLRYFTYRLKHRFGLISAPPPEEIAPPPASLDPEWRVGIPVSTSPA